MLVVNYVHGSKMFVSTNCLLFAVNWRHAINELNPSANLTFRTTKKSAMANWLTMVTQDGGIRLLTAAKLVVVHEVHKQIDNLLVSVKFLSVSCSFPITKLFK